jgi:hypothetical protein
MKIAKIKHMKTTISLLIIKNVSNLTKNVVEI